MIIKGTSCAGANRLGIHLTRTDTNERAEVKEIRGVVADTITGALREMEAIAAGAETTKPFYHGSINTRADERLTDEQRMKAIGWLEAALGLTNQPRVVVVHEKEGREHCHIVWSRIDIDRMAAISDSHNYRKHEQVARALEKEFGHERVQGAHIEREGKERPARTPSHIEMLQSQRTGISIQDAKELMTGIWKGTKNGKEFQAALEKQGWQLARGDRRDFVAIDPKGGIHGVARRIQGAKVADVRKRFADIDPQKLKSITQAQQVQRKRRGEPEREATPARKSARGRPQTAKPSPSKQQSEGRPADQPRNTTKPMRGAAKTAGKIGGGIFSALMGESAAPAPKKTKGASPVQEPDAQAQRRQELMRDLSRDIPPETERDAEIELDRGRERKRGQ